MQPTKGQLISEATFGFLQFFQKKNERLEQKLKFFVRFMEEWKTPKFPSEIN